MSAEELSRTEIDRARRMVDEDERRARVAWSMVSETGRERASAPVTAVQERIVEIGHVEAWHRLVDGTLGCGGAARRMAAEVDVDREVELLRRLRVRTLVPGDDGWVEWGDPHDAPHLLHVAGDGSPAEIAERAVSVVGSRASTTYGDAVARDLGAGLAFRGWSVVSGAAYGIDGMAHRGALAVEGRCVAVLPCGPGQVYPRGHADLVRAVAESGLLVTEHPVGAVARRHRFLSRNRIIAALSRGTCVVEAGLRSGSLNTAGWAEHLGRRVMAVPGPVTSVSSAGCHEAIRNLKARLVTDAAEILDLVAPVGEALEAADEALGPARPADALAPVERRIHDALQMGTSRSVEAVARETLLGAEEVLDHLTVLELDGWAVRAADGWRRGTGSTEGDRVTGSTGSRPRGAAPSDR